tara:strand:- start:776 stop:1702 length:927 start_codon:yes stop_codon:yes gene_type:complete
MLSASICWKITMSVRHVVIEEHAGQRLDNYLHRELKNVPRSRVYQMVRRGEVRINGGRVRVSYRLQRGDRLRIPPVRIDSRNESLIGEATINRIRRAIIYEDEELLVLNKPAGVAAHGGSGIRHGIIEILRQTRSDLTFELVHRLDRDTSGCMMVAKTRQMLLGLHAAFREARVKKRYDAVVAGDWPQGLRSVRHSLRRYTLQSGERRVRIDLHGDKARTDFEVQQRGARVTRLWVYPHTGRTHQIRVHAAAEGHAVVGDDKYQRSGPEAPRMMLHSSSLKLPDGRRFDADPDETFLETWNRLLREPD